MINGVRQFKLINALGREYDMTRPDALLHAPDGLGWGTERTVNRLGMTYIGINEKEIHQSPSGEMVFRTYEEYGRFLSFCQQGGLVLCYKPIDTWYYCECLISIQKSEIQWENNHLICPVQFTLLSYWYEKVVAQTAEPPEPVEPNYATVTGDPAVFNARYSYPIKDLSIAIQGTQELNGYDKPWVGGAGKNKLQVTATTQTINGVTFTVNSDGSVYVSGTGTAVANFTLYQGTAPSGNYILSGNISGSRLDLWKSGGGSVYDNGSGVAFTSDGSTSYIFRITTRANITYDITISPMIRLATVADSTFEPYANICPITSYDSVTITQAGSTTNTYEVELTGAGQVYKGTLDVTSGELVVSWACYRLKDYPAIFDYTYANKHGVQIPNVITENVERASGVCSACRVAPSNDAVLVDPNYMWVGVNNKTVFWIGILDTIGGSTIADYNAWIADKDYELAFELATPLTYTLTPTQLSNLIGQNSIQADAGAVTVTYRTDARTEYKIYPYQYSYKYGDTAQNVFDIDCDLPSYFKLTIFGERTNPSWRVVQNGSIVKSGKLNASIGSSQKLVINTDPKQTEIALYTLSNTRINNLYGYSDFATERIFALPQGECQVQVLTEDEQSPKVMIEVLKHV